MRRCYGDCSVSTLTSCIRTAPTVAVVVVAVAGRKHIRSSQPRAIPHNGSMTTGTESPIVGGYHTRPRCIETGTMVEVRSVGFRTCQVSEAGFASEHIRAWHSLTNAHGAMSGIRE